MSDRKLVDVLGLLDITIKASYVAFLSGSLHLTFQYPLVDGQLTVLEHMAAIVAERVDEIHRRLDEALSEGES